MIIAIRKEPNGSLYMDKDIFSRTQEVQDENGNIEIVPMFTDEELAQPPYNYTKVEIDDTYSDCQASDFDKDLTFNLEKYNARKQKEISEPRIRELKQLLASQDYKTIKYMQGELTEEEFSEVKAQCKSWRDEINKLEQEQVKNGL